MAGKSNKVKSNFGKKGWGVIVYCMALYFLCSCFLASATNIIPGAFAKAYGWDASQLLAYYTPAGWVGILGGIFFGQMIVKKGAKFAVIASLIAGAVAVMLHGFVSTPGQFFIIIALICFLATGFGTIIPNALITNWFPRKKGIALGWATMGLPLGTTIFIPIMSFLIANTGIKGAFIVLGGVLALLAVIGKLFISNTPEECGCYPDNDASSKDVLKENLEKQRNYKSSYTVKTLLKDKNMWKISIGFGIVWMVTLGIASQLVPFMISLQCPPPKAIGYMSIAGALGVIGSYAWGWLDQKVGTRLAGVYYCIWYIVALALLIISKSYQSAILPVMIAGFSLGGIGNLAPSIIGTVYGRMDFPYASRVIIPIITGIRNCAFFIMSYGMIKTGTFSGGYVILLVLSIVALPLIFTTKDVFVEEVATECAS